MGWFAPKDERETVRLRAEAVRLRAMSKFQSLDDVRNYIIDLLVEVCDESDLCLAAIVAEPLGNILLSLLESEAFTLDPASFNEKHETLRSAAKEREWLRHSIKILEQEPHYLALWRRKAKVWLVGIVDALPVAALCDPYPDGTVESTPALSAYSPLHSVIDEFPLLLSRTCCTFLDGDVAEAELFFEYRKAMERRLCAASGIAWNERFSTKRKVDLPSEKKGLPDSELIALYTEDTLLDGLFTLPVPVSIPRDTRFEHTHIIGGTGHGKTQLLQYLIMDDLHRALDHNLSLVVFDPDGTLIRRVSQTDYFGEYLLADRAIFIDPSDAEHPVSLNLFDVSDIPETDLRAKETIQNNTIELFEYFFDALIGSELTGKQSTLFRYLGLLLMQIPNANIHTLRELMENGTAFKPYMAKLQGSARIFFETRFFDKSLNETKKQILTRLWGILSSRSLDRIFSATRNSINFDQALQSGKIIFISTCKEYLGEEGSAIFARMMVALVAQAVIRRAALAPDARNDCYIYIDEAEGVIDQTLVRLLAQARKYRAAITFAHQHLDQLSSVNRAGVMANTSIKLAGGVSAKDAAALAPEFRTVASHLLGQAKTSAVSNFALFAKNITPSAMSFTVPLGYAESIDRLTANEYECLLQGSRERYGQAAHSHVPPDEPITTPDISKAPNTLEHSEHPCSPERTPPFETANTPPTYRKEGGGGVRHQAICQTIKECGEVAGFRASLEETILAGEGRVDVILRRDDITLCCEISVTTSKEHELQNVRKCLTYGVGRVLVVASIPRHLVSLERYITANLSESEQALIDYLLPDDLPAYFEKLMPENGVAETVVRGWKVVSRMGESKNLTLEVISKAMSEHISNINL